MWKLRLPASYYCPVFSKASLLRTEHTVPKIIWIFALKMSMSQSGNSSICLIFCARHIPYRCMTCICSVQDSLVFYSKIPIIFSIVQVLQKGKLNFSVPDRLVLNILGLNLFLSAFSTSLLQHFFRQREEEKNHFSTEQLRRTQGLHVFWVLWNLVYFFLFLGGMSALLFWSPRCSPLSIPTWP